MDVLKNTLAPQLRATAFAGMVVLGGLVIVVSVAVYTSRRQKRAANNARELPPPVAFARLSAFGRADELAELADLEDVPFEPVIIERRYPNWSGGRFLLLGMAVVFVGIMFVEGFTDLSARGIAAGAYAFGIMLARLIQCLRPTYYRIVPGRLDLLRFSQLTNKARILRRWNLLETKVAVWFDSQTVELQPHGAPATTIRLFGLSEPRRFVLALLQGAISTHRPPPLPDDQLLG